MDRKDVLITDRFDAAKLREARAAVAEALEDALRNPVGSKFTVSVAYNPLLAGFLLTVEK